MERSYQRNGIDRIVINVTAWERECKAEVFRTDSDGLPRFHLPVHYGYQLQNLACVHQNCHTASSRGSYQFESLLQQSIEQLDREAQ